MHTTETLTESSILPILLEIESVYGATMMRLFPPTVDVGPDEGFTAAKDIFGRKRIGDGLTHLVQSVEDPLVIAVDGPWGSGKTTFLKMWRGELSKLGFPTVYFDAFANDYFDDAFIPIAAEIVGIAKDRLATNSGKLEDLKRKATKVAKILSQSAVKLGLKVATLGSLDSADIEGALTKEVDTVFDKHLADLISKQDATKSDMDSFREALRTLPELLAVNLKEGEKPKPIVIIIDELDRCRPTYALQFLERMKHFFSVPSVHFVLGTNLNQLSNTVSFAYGSGIDGRLYLQKFIQLSVELYDSFENRQESTTAKYLNFLRNTQELKGKDFEFLNDCVAELRRIALAGKFSLRTIEQIFGHVLRVIAVVPENTLRVPDLVVGLIVLKLTSPHLYDRAKRGEITYSEIVRPLYFLDSSDPEINFQGSRFEEQLSIQNYSLMAWRVFTDRDCPDEILERFKPLLFKYTFRNVDERLNFVKWTANEQLDRFIPFVM